LTISQIFKPAETNKVATIAAIYFLGIFTGTLF
jgi:hypothetical protein